VITESFFRNITDRLKLLSASEPSVDMHSMQGERVLEVVKRLNFRNRQPIGATYIEIGATNNRNIVHEYDRMMERKCVGYQ
jgi:hypothetical protein